jgi:hypothetical protein
MSPLFSPLFSGAGEDGGPAATPAPVERVPAKYNAKSELTVTVENDVETFDFDLRS